MKTVLSAIQRHGSLFAVALVAGLSMTSCGSQASFSSERAPKKTEVKTTSSNGTAANSSNATAMKANGPATGSTSNSSPSGIDDSLSTNVDDLAVATPTPDPSTAATASPSATIPPAPTSTASVTPTPTSTASPTATPSSSATPTPTATPTPSATPDPACTTPAQTVVTRMSNTFKNNALNQYIQYKLSQTDCHGTPMPINMNEIRFDVNAHVATGKASIPFAAYLVTDPSSPLASGSLQTVTGKDMFGTVSAARWYYSTTNQVTIPASTYEIYFSLDYSCAVIHTMGSSAPYPATETIDSYIAFGTATPQTQALQVSNSQLSGSCR